MPTSRPEGMSEEMWGQVKTMFARDNLLNPGDPPDEQAIKLTERFLKKGFSMEQAMLNLVWENPQISSICSAMSNMTILQANVAAALNQTSLSINDKQRLDAYARHTASGFCAGCGSICEPAVDYRVPISDMMRCAMYVNSYKDRDMALSVFNALPPEIRANLTQVDYSKAEKCCPQHIQIGKVLKQLDDDLA